MDEWTQLLIGFVALGTLGAAPACDKNKKETQEETNAETKTPVRNADEASDESAAESADTGTADEEASIEERADEAGVAPALLNPGEADEKAPDTFNVRFETTSGTVVGEFHRDWAPKGADRLYNLVKLGYYENVAFFRVIDGFMAQFGLHGTPEVNDAWADATIEDDPVEKSNERGTITFAKRKKPNSRTTQLFINYRDNANLDDRGFAPVGEVVEGMDVVDELHAGYGDGVDQKMLRERGNSYLEEEFPNLDYIESAELVESE